MRRCFVYVDRHHLRWRAFANLRYGVRVARSVVFCGTPHFAVPSLKALAADPAFDVRLVIAQPDRPVGRKAVITPPPVKVAAQELGIPVWQPEKLNKDFALRTSHVDGRPDFLVVVAYGQILNDAVLAWPTIHPVNVHASLLPRWRGASPIQHAVLAGDRESGVTIQVMAKELDAGPILAAEMITLDPRETSESLFTRLAPLGAELLLRTLKAGHDPRPQPTEGITFCGKLSRADGVVNPETMTAEEIDRRVRALNPWPGVTWGTLKILKTALTQTATSAPLPCGGETTLHLVEVQVPGKKPVSGREWEHAKK